MAQQPLRSQSNVGGEEPLGAVVQAHIARGDVKGAFDYVGTIPPAGVGIVDELLSILHENGQWELAGRVVAASIDRAADQRTRALVVVLAFRRGVDDPLRRRIEFASKGRRLHKESMALREVFAIVCAAVETGQPDLLLRTLAMIVEQLPELSLRTLSSMLYSDGHDEASMQLLMTKSMQGSAVTMFYLMDMLRAAGHEDDADMLFVRVLAADPSRFAGTLRAMRNMGRLQQAEDLLTKLGRYSAVAGLRLCMALGEHPREYVDALLRGLADQRVDSLLHAVSVVGACVERSLMEDMLLTRSPEEVSEALACMTTPDSPSGVDLLTTAYAHAPVTLVCDCAVALIRKNLLDPTLALLGELAASGEAADVVRAASYLGQTDITTFRVLLYIAFTRCRHLPEVFNAIRRDGWIEVAFGYLRYLVGSIALADLADLCVNIVNFGIDDLFEELARSSSRRPDFALLLDEMQRRVEYKIAYRLREYCI